MILRNLRNSFLLASFLIVFTVQADELVKTSAPKPKFATSTVRLFQSQDYVRKHPAPDFWALMPYYLPQQDGAACGIASMSMIINAARAHQNLTASDALITQKAFVEKMKIDYSHGIALDDLGTDVKKALITYGLDPHSKSTVEVIHVDGSKAQAKKIRALLIENEKSDHNFILANFLQSEFTGDPEGAVGHISPVAAFDAAKNKVLIMDVDREYYEPYWVSFDTFIKGMNTSDDSQKKTRGLVFIGIR